MIFLLRYWQQITLLVIIAAGIAAYNVRIAAAERVGADRVYAEWREATNQALLDAAADEAKKQRALDAAKLETEKHAQAQINKAIATARTERAAADQLRQRLEAIGSGSGSSCSSPGALTTSPAIRVLADVAGQCVTQYQELAEAARRSYDSGKACEQQYDTVVNPSTPAR